MDPELQVDADLVSRVDEVSGFAKGRREGEDGHGVDVERNQGTEHQEGPQHPGHPRDEGQSVQVPVVQQRGLEVWKPKLMSTMT